MLKCLQGGSTSLQAAVGVRARWSTGHRVSQEQLALRQVDGQQFEGGMFARWDLGTSEQGKGLVGTSAKQFGRHGEEELVDEVVRDQGVVEAGPAFDHEG